MTTRHITTSHEHDVCDICGRTLLRGESTEAFLDGSRRYAVCELCKSHALHEGWVREGTIPEFQGAGGGSRPRRSLLGRLRGRVPAVGGATLTDDGARPEPQTLDDELSVADWQPARGRGAVRDGEPGVAQAADLAAGGRRERSRSRSRARDGDPAAAGSAAAGSAAERRHVHAVPTSGDHKVATAVAAFNRSEHTRTVAGVSRSLGAAGVSLTPDPDRPTVVWLVTWWELCWYRYEIELSDDPGSVRLDAQGYELDELADHERLPNATADEAGRLAS